MEAGLTIGSRIRQAREALALTQDQLGNAASVTGRSIHNWEADFNKPTETSIKKLALVLGVSKEWIRTGIQEATSTETPTDVPPLPKHFSPVDLEAAWVTVYSALTEVGITVKPDIETLLIVHVLNTAKASGRPPVSTDVFQGLRRYVIPENS